MEHELPTMSQSMYRLSTKQAYTSSETGNKAILVMYTA